MSSLRRMGATLSASFNSLIDQVENHEAVAGSVIRSVEESAAKAKVHLKRVRRDLEKLRHRLAQLEHEAASWKSRARKVHELDEERALECVRRLKRVERERRAVQEQHQEQAEIEKQLAHDVQIVDDKLTELHRQKNILATRESRAEALKGVHAQEYHLVSELEGVFDRWDTKITREEIIVQVGDQTTDELDRSFREEEEEAELRSSLAELLKEHQPTPAGEE